MAVSTAPVSRTWALPSPKTWRRINHNRVGLSSIPITNSSNTTPISAR